MSGLQAISDPRSLRKTSNTEQVNSLASHLSAYLCLCEVELSPSIELQIIAVAESTLEAHPWPGADVSTGTLPPAAIQQGLATLSRQFALPAIPERPVPPPFKRSSIDYGHYG